MHVKKALHGHPESRRIWAILIDDTIQDLNLKPVTMRPTYTTQTTIRVLERLFCSSTELTTLPSPVRMMQFPNKKIAFMRSI